MNIFNPVTGMDIVRASYLRLYCIHFYVINYSLNFATLVNTILLLFVCNACLPTSHLETNFCRVWLA